MNAVTELFAHMNSGEYDSKTRGLEVVEAENNCEKKHDGGQQIAALNSLCCNLNRPTALFSSGENEVLISEILKVIANFDILKADSWKRWSLSEIQTALDIMFELAGVSARGCSAEDCRRYAQFHENWRGLVENVPVVQKLIDGEDINTSSVNIETEGVDSATVAAVRELCKQLKRPVALFSARTPMPTLFDILPIIAHLDVSAEDSWTRWTLSDIQLALNIVHGLFGVDARDGPDDGWRFAAFQDNFFALMDHVPLVQRIVNGEDINTFRQCALSTVAIRPIRIALSVDERSFGDIVILINSVIESAVNPDDLVVHVLACGKDLMAANILKRSIIQTLGSCFPNLTTEVVPFYLPIESGFTAQLAAQRANPKKVSHWNSQIGADFARFFLAKTFPNAERLLYLDNDIVVSCCLEEIFDSDLGTDKVIGIALDDLQWAVVTQFRNHYNASHPVVVKNMRRNQTAMNQFIHSAEPVSKEEFQKALPRYPNDGVLLIDVKRFNEAKILDSLEEIAAHNGMGEYVVNLGTQQFTVLTMFDRWAEITPRANMRHFPDMARGYLMWFYYNGFTHYAGQAKPSKLCHEGNYKDNWLRVGSYTAWAHSNAQVAAKCAHDKTVYAQQCVQHIPVTHTLLDLVLLLHQITRITGDETLEYVHVGALHGDLGVGKYQGDYDTIHSYGTTSSAGDDGSKELDFIEVFDRIALHNASWSYRNYDCAHINSTSSSNREAFITCDKILNTAADSIYVSSKTVAAAKGEVARQIAKAQKKGLVLTLPHIPDNQLRFGGKRSFIVLDKHLCLGAANGTKIIDENSGGSGDGSGEKSKCTSLLEDVRGEGKKHWDVVAVVIDVTPPSYLFPPTSTSGSNSAAESSRGGGNVMSHSASQPHTSLSILLGLDFVFLRPKFVAIRLSASSPALLAEEVNTARRFLSRNGFVVQQEKEGFCVNTNKFTSSGGGSVADNSAFLFACLWGTRVNSFEYATH